MDPFSTLRAQGLTEKEASVYLALLELGPASVLALARRTGLKRPTIYLVLDDLSRRGLTALVPREKKKLFVALPPERLREDLENKLETLNKLLPQLTAIYRTQTARPAIQLFESKDGIVEAYREITESDAKEILSFFSLETIPPEFQISYKMFADAFRKGKRGREIVYTADRHHPYLKDVASIRNYEVRFTAAPNKFLTDNIVYGNKIALFSFQKRFALIIESEDVARSMRSLFELAWQAAAG